MLMETTHCGESMFSGVTVHTEGWCNGKVNCVYKMHGSVLRFVQEHKMKILSLFQLFLFQKCHVSSPHSVHILLVFLLGMKTAWSLSHNGVPLS